MREYYCDMVHVNEVEGILNNDRGRNVSGIQVEYAEKGMVVLIYERDKEVRF